MCLIKLGAALRISSDFSQRSHSRAQPTSTHQKKIHFFPFIRLAESCIAYIKVLCTHTKSRTEWKFSISCQPFFALFFFVCSRSGRAELMLSRLRPQPSPALRPFFESNLSAAAVCVFFPPTCSVSLWSACGLFRAACAGGRQRSAYVVRCVCVRVYLVRERAHVCVCACGRVNVCIG